jgi:hypothetical protein
MPITRQRLIIASCATLAFICWYWYWSSASIQVPRTFTRIREGVNESRSGLIMDQLHPDYSIKECWPTVFAEYGGLASPGGFRLLAQQGVQLLLRSHADDPVVMSYDLHKIAVQPDGTVLVDVSIQFSTRSGQVLGLVDPPLTHKHFTLARSSAIFPALSIVSHEPFTANY